MSSQIACQVVEAFKNAALKTEASAKLAPKERQVLELLAQGHLYKEIADQLGITIGTVRVYIRKIYEKLQVHTRTEAINKAFPRRPVER